MKKRLTAIILAAMLLLSFSVCAFADTSVNAARKGVAKILEVFYVDGEVYYDGDYYWIFSGSGFFVGNSGEDVQYLVTNYHVIEEYVENGKGEKYEIKDSYGQKHTCQWFINVAFDSDDYMEAYVVDYDETQDIAVLKLEKKTSEREPLTLEIPTDEMVGESMYIIGYPGNVEGAVDTTSAWGVEDAVVSKGTIGRLATESGSGSKWIQSTDTVSSYGNSGGPLLSEEGTVIGVACLMSTGDVEEFFTQGVNIEKVCEMLTKNQIPFMSADEPVPEPSPDPVVPTPVPTEKPIDPVPSTAVIIAIAAILLAAIAAVVVVVLNKSKKAKEPVPQSGPQDSIGGTVKVNPSTPIVRSLSQQHGNKKVAIKSGGSITIGRARDCTIVFKEDTPGVSGRHCAVTFNPQNKMFIITDLGSTYGTYLESGMKLDANRNYTIKPGDRFYLGEKANMLRVEVE